MLITWQQKITVFTGFWRLNTMELILNQNISGTVCWWRKNEWKIQCKSVYLLYSPWKCLYSNVSCFRQFQFGWNINILLLGTIPLPCPENKIYKITGLYYAECLFMINLNWQFINNAEAAREQCGLLKKRDNTIL